MEYLCDLSKNLSNKVHCPFNLAHAMPRKTFEKHILKCPDKPRNYKHCFYNNLHVMIDTELEKHEETCPNRVLMDEYLYPSEDVVRPNVTVSKEPVIEQTEELWDEPSGNEKMTIKHIDTIRNSMKPISGLTKNQRKKNRRLAHKEFPNLDLSYNPDLSISDRLDAAASSSKSTGLDAGASSSKSMGLDAGASSSKSMGLYAGASSSKSMGLYAGASSSKSMGLDDVAASSSKSMGLDDVAASSSKSMPSQQEQKDQKTKKSKNKKGKKKPQL